MAKFGNKYFRNIGSVSNKILQRLSFYRQTPGADFTFGGKSFNNIAYSGVPIYQRLPSGTSGTSGTVANISVTSITDSTQAAYLAWLASNTP